MRHGWRSSSGVRTPVRLSVQGPPVEVPATTPFSSPLHHRYRRWIGGVSRPRTFSCQTLSASALQKRSARHSTPAAVPSVTGTTVRRNRISSSYFSSPLARDSNPVLQGCSRLHSHCSTLPNTCLGHWPHSQHQWVNRNRLHKAHKGRAFGPLPPHMRACLPFNAFPPPRAPVAPRRDRSPVPCTGSAPQMVGHSRAGSHGSATVEPYTLYFSPVYYSM